MTQVLGVSVSDMQIASVVMEVATGNVLARNTADVLDASPESVLDALTQLVATVPFEVESITVACALRSMQVSLHNTVTGGAAGDPAWYLRTIITDTPFAFANVAAAQSDQRGTVVVIDLADDAVPFNELSIAAVDTESASVIGAIQLPSGGVREPVTEPAGAATVAEAFAMLPAEAAGRAGVLVVGPGAQVPGVGPSLEYETQLPVQIAQEPVYSAAHGAALHGRSRGRVRTGARGRWLILGAAAAAALLLAIVVACVVLFVDDDPPAPAGSSSSRASTSDTTTSTTASSRRPRPTTTTTSTTPTTTTPIAPTTAPAPPPPATVTVTRPPRTVTRTPAPSSSEPPTSSTSVTPSTSVTSSAVIPGG